MLQLKLGWGISQKCNILRLPFHFKMSHHNNSSSRWLLGEPFVSSAHSCFAAQAGTGGYTASRPAREISNSAAPPDPSLLNHALVSTSPSLAACCPLFAARWRDPLGRVDTDGIWPRPPKQDTELSCAERPVSNAWTLRERGWKQTAVGAEGAMGWEPRGNEGQQPGTQWHLRHGSFIPNT